MRRSPQTIHQQRAGEAHSVTVHRRHPSPNRSRGKCRRWAKGSISPTPTHLHHTIISLYHLRYSTTSHIINHHHRRITNSSNHLHHLHHNSGPQTPRVHPLATYKSHHGPQIIEPHLRLNIMETLILGNFSCATKLP
jgi:hypothetical protein